MIFTPNKTYKTYALRELKVGQYFTVQSWREFFCKLNMCDYADNVFCLNYGEVQEFNVDMTVLPIDITEVKFNYV